MAVTKDQVAYIASLAKLEFSEDELEVFTEEMDQIIEFAHTLSQLDTEGIAPTAHILGVDNILRTDSEPHDFPTDDALHNAPNRVDNCFTVPKVVE